MRTKRNDVLAKRLIQQLERRNMEGYYVHTKEEALKKILELIPNGSSIGWGGCHSAQEIGLIEALYKGNYQLIDRDQAKDLDEKRQLERECFFANYFIMSSNAITDSGVLVNMDGKANRVACLCYGPDHVIVLVGMNKVVHSVEDAISRVRNEAAVINNQRFEGNRPCQKVGVCANCLEDGCICDQMVITRRSMVKGRIKVVLVDDVLGY